MKATKTDKVCRGVFKAYLAKSKPATDAQQLALNFSAQNARYFNNLAAEDLKQIIDAGRLLKNCPFGLAALNATELRTVIAIFALMYEQTAANDALTTTEQPRGTFTAFTFSLLEIRKKALFDAKRLPEVCAAILEIENKVFFSADGKGADKYFANPFLYIAVIVSGILAGLSLLGSLLITFGAKDRLSVSCMQQSVSEEELEMIVREDLPQTKSKYLSKRAANRSVDKLGEDAVLDQQIRGGDPIGDIYKTGQKELNDCRELYLCAVIRPTDQNIYSDRTTLSDDPRQAASARSTVPVSTIINNIFLLIK